MYPIIQRNVLYIYIYIHTCRFQISSLSTAKLEKMKFSKNFLGAQSAHRSSNSQEWDRRNGEIRGQKIGSS